MGRRRQEGARVETSVRLVAGLPGSGKTPYLEKLREEGWEVFDDFNANAYQNSDHFKKARRYDELIRTLRQGRKCAVADMAFCRERDQSEAERMLRGRSSRCRSSVAVLQERPAGVHGEHSQGAPSSRVEASQAAGVLEGIFGACRRRVLASVAQSRPARLIGRWALYAGFGSSPPEFQNPPGARQEPR